MASSDESSRQQRLERIFSDYLRAQEQGEPIDCDQLISENPDLFVELQHFFENRAAIERVANTPTVGSVELEVTDQNRFISYFGDYELLEELGRGGMGVVYRARQVSLRRLVAVKMILAGRLANAEDVHRFHAEAETAANLDHPHIVPIFEVGQVEDHHYFSMGYVNGKSLAARVAAGPLAPRDAALLTQKLAGAIAYAHSRGVVHRDLKPANVLIDENGEPRVTDFGLAKRTSSEDATALEALTATGQILGTPGFMSPEQASGIPAKIGPAADIYSLGATLFNLLTARPPFQSSNIVETIRHVLEREPPAPRQLNPAVPVDLETICLKCLEKNPGNRYPTAKDLQEDLNRFLRHEPVLARPISRAERLLRWVVRRPSLAAAWALLLLSLIFGSASGIAFWQWREAGMARDKEEQARGRAEVALKMEQGLRIEVEKARIQVEHSRDAEQKQRERAESEHQRAERFAYAGQMLLAQRAIEQWELGAARKHLEACRSELRGWEHQILEAAFEQMLHTIKGHNKPVSSVVVTHDGTRIVSGSHDRSVRVWAAATGAELLKLDGHEQSVNCVDISPDGKRIVSGSISYQVPGELFVWNAETGEKVLILAGHKEGIQGVAYSPDGSRIVSAGEDHVLKVWNASTGQELNTFTGHTNWVLGAAFSPDGKQIVSGSKDSTLKIWDAESGACLQTLTGHSMEVGSVCYSADGKRIVSGSDDKTVRVWDAESGEMLLTFQGHTHPIESVAASPNGDLIASASFDHTVKLWNLKAGTEWLTFRDHTWAVLSVAFSPDGGRVISGAGDNTIKIWDLVKVNEVSDLKDHEDRVTSVAFSPDGKRIASGSWDGTVKLWDPSQGTVLLSRKGHAGFVNSVTFSPDGKTFLAGGGEELGQRGEIKLWDATKGTELQSFPGHAGAVKSVAFTSDGSRIVSASHDNTIRVWNAISGAEVLKLEGHTQRILCAAVSPNDTRIASGSEDNTLKIWDAKTGVLLHSLEHTSDLECVAFSPDSSHIVSCNDRRINIWDVGSGVLVTTLSGHTRAVRCASYSPDGNRILSGSLDNTIRIYDSVAAVHLLTLNGAGSGITSLAFSPDGKQVAAGGDDRLVRVWNPYRGIHAVNKTPARP